MKLIALRNGSKRKGNEPDYLLYQPGAVGSGKAKGSMFREKSKTTKLTYFNIYLFTKEGV
jgi:hypothetical protein